MLQQYDFYQSIQNKALSEHFLKAGDMLADEAEILGGAVRHLMAAGETINNKNIITALIESLECTDSVVSADVIRKTLEIVVDHTLDDI
ncbi:biofilm development regulator YmgB/AriR family protein [Pseudocitrobacter sp. 73]|uniref:biofilm development regulator YmgB/AriR family protein n=1 Tax=Pseudocitrobacter sp. 73 TaxID=2605731 RepID=UPI0011EE3646|nr:biofilm development regulator YmgB/AriR family protein [Pseudocitrobacter sp. 73]KAA1049903.1 two-component-system connector protein AriR [Pseudocitrobacter sp. 73]